MDQNQIPQSPSPRNVVDVTLTEKQANMLSQAHAQAQQADQRVKITLAAILAGADIDNGTISGYDEKTRTLSVTLPNEEVDD